MAPTRPRRRPAARRDAVVPRHSISARVIAIVAIMTFLASLPPAA